MKVSVIVPDEYMGDVIGDLNARRGQIQGMEARTGAQQIDAFVPLAEMFGYATDLRSRTQGRGQYTMEPSHYVEIPKSIAEKIIAGRTQEGLKSLSCEKMRCIFPLNAVQYRTDNARHWPLICSEFTYKEDTYKWLKQNLSVPSPMLTSAPSATLTTARPL